MNQVIRRKINLNTKNFNWVNLPGGNKLGVVVNSNGDLVAKNPQTIDRFSKMVLEMKKLLEN